MTESLVLYEASRPAVVVTLNRPDRRNALSRGLIAALTDAFSRAAGDADARCVILTGAGPVFCAGMDLAELQESLSAGAEDTPVWDDALRLATWTLAATGTADSALLAQAALLARHAHDYPQVITLLRAIPDARHTHATWLLLGESHFELLDFDTAELAFARAQQAADGFEQQLAVVMERTQNLFWGAGQPLFGLIADKFGTWRVLLLSAIFYASGLIMMANADSPALLHIGGGILVGRRIAEGRRIRGRGETTRTPRSARALRTGSPHTRRPATGSCGPQARSGSSGCGALRPGSTANS